MTFKIITKTSLKLGLIVAAIHLAGSIGHAVPVNITIHDQLPGPAPTIPANENNETEPGTLPGQVWDLEAMVYDPSTKALTIVGGFNFQTGQAGGGRTFHTGDIYIDVDGGLLALPPEDAGGNAYNLRNGAFGYDFVVRFKNRLNVPTSGTSSSHSNFGQLVDFSYEIIDLRAGTSKNWDVFFSSTGESNPFIYDSGGTVLASPVPPPQTAVFATYADDAAVDAAFAGTVGWIPGSTATGWSGVNTHYSLTVDISNIVALLGISLDEAKFTIGCGNDMIRGDFTRGNLAPDGGLTLILLGGALGSLWVMSAAAARRRAQH